MKVKGKYSESAVLYAIILSVAAVLAIIVFFVVLGMTKTDDNNGSGANAPANGTTTAASDEAEPENKGYEADRELANEMMDAVQTLIYDNYTVLRLYYTKGLAHKDEPYGNTPEDGYYTVDDDKYTSLEQIEEIVDRTYTKECAADVKTDPLGYGAIYKTRDNGTLGIIAGYTPMQYDNSWENPQFEITPESDTVCGISITIHSKADESEVPLEAEMIKTEGGWRLTSVIF